MFFYFQVVEYILVLFYHSFHTSWEKENRCNLIKFCLFTKNQQIQYKNIIELYWTVLYFVNICYNIFISYEIFNFVWKMLNSKAIKIYLIMAISIQNLL